jgi:pimeloyl-ACP methyl ester carboxylesterase
MRADSFSSVVRSAIASQRLPSADSGRPLRTGVQGFTVTLVPEETRLSVDEVVLSLRVWPCRRPAGPVVVLLPGTGATAQDWDGVAARVSEERPVVAVDLRGHGRSDWPGRYSIQLFADDVSAALDQLGGGPVDLVGHSLGGLVACKVAAARHDLVRRLVLEDVGVPHRREPDMPARPRGQLPFDWAMVEQVRPEIDDPDPTWPETVAGIQAPTLVVGGGPRSFVPQQHVAELVDRLRDGRLTTIDVGHLVHESSPEEFTDRLMAFIRT